MDGVTYKITLERLNDKHEPDGYSLHVGMNVKSDETVEVAERVYGLATEALKNKFIYDLTKDAK